MEMQQQPHEISIAGIKNVDHHMQHSSSSPSSPSHHHHSILSPPTTTSSGGIDISPSITAPNAFVTNGKLNREQKVHSLGKLCENGLDQLYECEMKYGNNAKVCETIGAAFKGCLSLSLCPNEAMSQKASQCDSFLSFDPHSNNNSKSIDQINQCFQLNKSLNSCMDRSLQTIWTTHD